MKFAVLALFHVQYINFKKPENLKLLYHLSALGVVEQCGQ